MSRVRVYGVDIQEIYARRLVGNLTNAGTPAALAAANQLSGALKRQNSTGPLTPEMRDAILAALPTPPQPGIKPLHRALFQDQAARRDTEL